MELNKIIAVLVAIVVALLSWNLYTTHMLVVQVSVIDERTKGANFALMEQRIVRLEQWNQNISTRLQSIENAIREVNE